MEYNYNQNNLQQPNTLTLGILSLVFGSIVGIILGSIGRKKGKEFLAQGGELTGASKVGFILSKVGVILGIISTIFIVLYIILIAAGAVAYNY
ncbi:MAG: hypothetical protein IJI34_08750 [Clostridia bacterium]|nr:hypothetical protein [Clostridia bacterium]